MSSSLDHKCQRCGSQYHGQVCPFCTITGLDVNALLASEGLTMPQAPGTPAAPETPAAEAILVDVVTNRTYPLAAAVCRFGRDISNDVVLTGDKSLSRFHFQVTVNGEEYFVEDAGSRNGTFLNGSPVTQARKLVNGDIISAGMSRYRVVLGDEEIQAHANGDGKAAEAQTDTGAQPAEPATNFAPTEEVAKPTKKPETVKTASGERYSLDDYAVPENEPAAKAAPAVQKAAEPAPQPAAAEPAPKPTAQEAPKPAPQDAPTAPPLEPKRTRIPQGNKMESDADSSSLDSLIPGREDELSDTASRFLKLAENPADRLWPIGSEDDVEVKPSQGKANEPDTRDWPAWCTEFTFTELDHLKGRVQQIEAEIAARQVELEGLARTLQDAEGLKNRLLATRDNEMVEACSAVFRGLGWETQLNAGTNNELVLSSGGKALALLKVVCTETQPKPNELANLVSSLSNYWSENGVEPKGIMLVAFLQDGPLQNRPELSKDLADYASKKNVCLMNSLQLLSIYRDAALRGSDVEAIKSDLLAASGMLPGHEL